jgi:hypothetical protein
MEWTHEKGVLRINGLGDPRARVHKTGDVYTWRVVHHHKLVANGEEISRVTACAKAEEALKAVGWDG